MYPVSSVKERNRKGGKCVSSPQASPKVEASNRLKQAQHFSTHRKVQNGNSRVHQDLPDSRGMGIVNRPIGLLPSHPHPPKLKEIPKVLPQVTGVPLHLPSFGTSRSPPGLCNDHKESEANGPLQRTHTSPIPGRLTDQVPVSRGSPSEHSGSGSPNPVLGVDNKSGKIIRGLQIQSMPQTSGFDPVSQVKTSLDCKMFDVSNWVACLNGENGPGGAPSHEAISVSPQGALEISSVAGQPPSLDRNDFCTPRLVAEPHKCAERCGPSSQRHSIQLFTDTSNEAWGAHLSQSSTKGLWSDGEKRLHINVLELKAVSLALRSFKDQCQNQTVLVATDNSTVVAYINKQEGTYSAEMCALLWKIMTWCHR